MAEYTLKYINHRARYDAAAFIAECEQHYHEQVLCVADEITENSVHKPIVLINGPSSSGKTTTNDRLARALEQRGIHAEMISMDDYYRTVGTYEIPPDPENGVPDLESPECMNLPLLSHHLAQLAAGEEIALPRFDFETRTSIPEARALRLDPDEVVLIEGIHSFNPVIMGDLAHAATSVYLSVASAVVPEVGPRIEPYMLRFLRRAMRDSLFRNSPVEETIRQWNSVRRGERLYISQQSLSNHISNMERELDVKLFTRSPKLSLTYAGDLLVETATQILDLHSQYLAKVGDINRHYMGVLRLGISHTCGLALLPEVLPKFQAEFPMVDFSLFEGNSTHLEDELAHGRVDLVIAFHPHHAGGGGDRPPDRGPAHHGGAQGLHRPGVRSPGGGDAGPVRPWGGYHRLPADALHPAQAGNRCGALWTST